MQLLAPAAIALVLVGGGFAVHHSGVLDEFGQPGAYPSDNCYGAPLVPLTTAPDAEMRRIDFVIDNRAQADQAAVCLFDENLVKRYHKEFSVPSAEITRQGFDVPAQYWFAETVLGAAPKDAGAVDGQAAGNGWTAGGTWVKPCRDGVTEVVTINTFQATSRRSEGLRERCGEAQMSLDGQPIIPDDADNGPGSGAVVATVVVGSGVALGLVVWAKHLGWFALFSRLHRPTLLDHDRRSRIAELIESDPGIHASAIANTLELSHGVVAHHLGVLTRERIVSKVGTLGFRHYFSFGKFSPRRMQALATSRRPAARRLLEAVAASPAASLSSLSATTGLSVARLSRLAKDLEAAALLRRETVGRKVVLRPVPLPA